MKQIALSLKRTGTQMNIESLNLKLKHWCLMGLTIILVGCSSAAEEEYFDYFYTTKTTPEGKSFTYILYIGEEGDHRIPDESRSSGSHHDQQGGNVSNQRKKRSGKPKVDDFMSLSFRMEEEAFKRLEKKLRERNYCTEKPNYSSNEYTWLTYTIKGSCS